MSGASARQRIASAVVAVIAALSGAALASAHSGLGAASPAPGAVVGGEISEIQLRYASAVVDVAGSVTDPDGDTIATEFVQDTSLAVTIRLATPLTTPGEYAVRHSSTSVDDGDRVDAAYLFTYDPAAPPPRLEILDPDDDGTSIWVWVVLGAGVVLVAGLAWRLLAAVSASRVRRSVADGSA